MITCTGGTMPVPIWEFITTDVGFTDKVAVFATVSVTGIVMVGFPALGEFNCTLSTYVPAARPASTVELMLKVSDEAVAGLGCEIMRKLGPPEVAGVTVVVKVNAEFGVELVTCTV